MGVMGRTWGLAEGIERLEMYGVWQRGVAKERGGGGGGDTQIATPVSTQYDNQQIGTEGDEGKSRKVEKERVESIQEAEGSRDEEGEVGRGEGAE
jgi:hypothetical protein